MTIRKNVTIRNIVLAGGIAASLSLSLTGCEMIQTGLNQLQGLQSLLSGASGQPFNADKQTPCEKDSAGQFILPESWPADAPVPAGTILNCFYGTDGNTNGKFWTLDIGGVSYEANDAFIGSLLNTGYSIGSEMYNVYGNGTSWIEPNYDPANSSLFYTVRNLAPDTAILPDGWPTDVPMPAEQLSNANNQGDENNPSWVAYYRVADVNASLAAYSDVLLQSGYTLVNKSEDMQTGMKSYSFNNGTYEVMASTTPDDGGLSTWILPTPK